MTVSHSHDLPIHAVDGDHAFVLSVDDDSAGRVSYRNSRTVFRIGSLDASNDGIRDNDVNRHAFVCSNVSFKRTETFVFGQQEALAVFIESQELALRCEISGMGISYQPVFVRRGLLLLCLVELTYDVLSVQIVYELDQVVAGRNR